jgi:hypothetical protein
MSRPASPCIQSRGRSALAGGVIGTMIGALQVVFLFGGF